MNLFWTIWKLTCLNGDQILHNTINSRGFYIKNFWLLTKPFILSPNIMDGEYVLDFGYFIDHNSFDNKSHFPGLATPFPNYDVFRILGGFVGGTQTKLRFKCDVSEKLYTSGKLSHNEINRMSRPGHFLRFQHNGLDYAIFQGTRTKRMHVVRFNIIASIPFIFLFIPLSINYTMREINKNLEILSASEALLEVHDS